MLRDALVAEPMVLLFTESYGFWQDKFSGSLTFPILSHTHATDRDVHLKKAYGPLVEYRKL